MRKQGRADSSRYVNQGGVVPSKAISPAWTNEMGVAYGTHTTDGKETSGGQSPMSTGPGLRAPIQATTIHKGGSQGRR